MLYELATGAPPFTGDSPLQVAYRHLEEAPAAPHAVRRDVPPALGAVILRLLAKHPGDRYRRAEEAAADLGRLPAGLPAATGPLPRGRTRILRHPAPSDEGASRRRPLSWVIGATGAAVAVTAAVVIALALRPEPARSGGGPRTVRPVSGLSARSTCDGWLSAEVVLRWEPSTSPAADGYDVYRSVESGGQYDRVAFVPGRDSRGYADSEVELGTTYFYVVKATTGRRDSREVQTQADTPSVCLF